MPWIVNDLLRLLVLMLIILVMCYWYVSSYYRTLVGEFGTKQCWNQGFVAKSETPIDQWIDWEPSIDQWIDWEPGSANSKLLDRSADRSSRILSQTESSGIDRSIDREIAPANRELWNRSLDRLASLDRSADRSRILPEHSSHLNRSIDRSNSLQSIEFNLDWLGSWVLTKWPCNSVPWP